MALTRGTVFGAYEIGEPIGAGGMGEVYRAHDAALGRDVAIKVLPESFASDAHRVARFEQEAKTLAALNHPNVAQIYGLERSGETTALVMELVEGPTLADRIEHGALSVDDTLTIALQITAALEAAHERGIVHRDLKPANIKLRADGTVKVLDFGIAKALEHRAVSGPMPAAALTSPSMTEAGLILGTAAYMSPEQARGKPVDKRADIWAFGCVLYEMLTGQPAFLGDDVTTTLARVIERDPDMRPLPAGLAPAVRGTLELCLKKDPAKRMHDIGDVRLALQGGLAALAPARGVAAELPLWRRALPVTAALVAGAVLAGAYFTTRVEPQPIAPAPPELPITRFAVTPPPAAPLASLGGFDVTISPDGKRIAYFVEDPERGSVSLYVRDLDSLEARPIPGTEVTNTSGGNMNPFFSPDGRSIGYLAPDRGVVRVSIDGAPPTRILDPPSPAFLGATWTDDDTIVYSPGRSLQSISAGAGGTPTALTSDYDADTYIASPTLLPGGRAVLFSEIVNGVESVAVVDLASGETKTLIEGGQNATYAPSGHIVFARGTTLMAVPFDVNELALTGDAVAVVPNVRHPNSLSAADYAISKSGTLIYVPGGGESGGLSNAVWIDRAGNVVGPPIAENLDNPRDPRLSPDGTKLLLTTGPIADSDLWIYDLGGRPPIPLALAGSNLLGVWSPDSAQVAFAQLRGDADSLTIVTLPASGDVGTPQLLGGAELIGAPASWSTAGEILFVSAEGSNEDISVAPIAATGEARAAVATEYNEWDAALSRDGRWLAYASDRTGAPEIWVQAYTGGAPVRVSPNGGWEPRWSADGTELYYLQGSSVWAVAIEPGDRFTFKAPVPLFNTAHYMNISEFVGSYDVAADGRFLMIQATGSEDAPGGSASIVVVENWADELKRRVPPRR